MSLKFDGVPLLERHRLINDALKEELASGVHALSIQAKTPTQWAQSGGKVQDTPACRGGGVG